MKSSESCKLTICNGEQIKCWSVFFFTGLASVFILQETQSCLLCFWLALGLSLTYFANLQLEKLQKLARSETFVTALSWSIISALRMQNTCGFLQASKSNMYCNFCLNNDTETSLIPGRQVGQTATVRHNLLHQMKISLPKKSGSSL